MSLFGGDSSAPPTESPYDSELDNPASSIERSPPRTSLRSPQNAQITNNVQDLHEQISGDAAQDLAGNEADSEESDEEHTERPNRFRGPPQTWKGYTAADRQIAESLQQLEDTDLAAHLYDAHALKRRVRRPAAETMALNNWQNKDTWLKKGKELKYADGSGQTQTELVPAKDWTAWPLPPASLFTPDNGLRRAAVVAEDDEWVIGSGGTQDPGEALKEEMLGLFLRLAKDNWNAKDWHSDAQHGARRRAQSRTKARSKSASRADVEMKYGSGLDTEDDEKKATQDGGAKRGRKPQLEANVPPVILADDAKAQRLLRPTISSMLSKLDDVALALHRTRLNHFGRGAFGEDSSQSEFATDAESTGRESRSRSQSVSKSASHRRVTTRLSLSGRASRAANSPKKSSKAQFEPQDSDSASDYGAEFDNKNIPSSNVPSSPIFRRKRSRSEDTMDGDDVSNTRDWSRAGLMDWSEVLGMAAVKGWNKEAIARTAQRCSTLFGESMSFMSFQEDLATKASTEPVPYIPSTIPPPTELGISKPRSTKRPYFQPGTIRCPHADCYGHNKDFAMSYRVIEHCMRIHGYDPRSNDSDNEERTHGGVHIDGFLQPITAKQGWLGHGRSKAGGKKRKTDDADLSGLHGVVARNGEHEI
jgi:hypothetical protein